MPPSMDRATVLELVEHHGRSTPGLRAPLPVRPRGGGNNGFAVPGRVRMINPTCGDVVEFTLQRSADRVFLRGSATGCTLSSASASLLAEALEGRPTTEAHALVLDLVAAREQGSACSVQHDVAALAGLTVAPLRRRCILLPWSAAAQILTDGGHARTEDLHGGNHPSKV